MSAADPKTIRPFLPCSPSEVDDFLSQPTSRVCDVLDKAPGPFMVLGAGGKMGLHLSVMLRRALDELGRKDPVFAVSRFRTLHQCSDFEKHGVKVHSCDLGEPKDLEKLPEAATVFYLAGAKFGTADSPELLRRANIEIPQQVAKRFCHSQIVAFSTGCVYPFMSCKSTGATESTKPAPVGDYAASCLERERAFTESSVLHNNPSVLIRLNYSVEFRYGVLVDIADKVYKGLPVDVSMGYVNVIWQSDAVCHTIQALELAGVPAVPINITGPDVLSVRTLAHRFGEVLGRTAQITGQENETAWLSSAAHSHKLFGMPSVSVETMISWIAGWMLQGGQTWGKPTGFEKRDGKF